MTEHGATQVIIELARGHVGGASFELSLEQMVLRIPKSSIYLAALCFADDDEEESPQHPPPSPPFSAQQQERFSALQKQYLGYCLISSSGKKEENKTTKSDTDDGADAFIYQLSPRLCPTAKQLRIVRHDIRATMERLEALAQRSMQELLHDESLKQQKQQQQNMGKTGAGSRSATKQKYIGGRVSVGGAASAKEDGSSHPIDLNPNDDVRDGESDNNNGDDDSLQEEAGASMVDLLAMNQTCRMASAIVILNDVTALRPNQNSDEEEDDHTHDAASSWVEVKRKTSSTKPLTEPDAGSTFEGEKPQSSVSTNHETSVSLNAVKKNTKGELSNKEATAVLKAPPIERVIRRLGVPGGETAKSRGQHGANVDQGEDDKSPTPSQTIYEGEESHKVAVEEQPPPDLQLQSQQKGYFKERDESVLQQQLEQERAAHAKEMARVKQQHDDLVQGLQLRLYISETKLRTYQEALEEHVNAVANNVAVSTNTPISKTSGKSATSNDNNHGDVLPSLSLISKSWSQNKTRQATPS